MLLKRSEAPRSLMVVYATGYSNFDISFPLLHCLIAEQADAVLYVKNPALGIRTDWSVGSTFRIVAGRASPAAADRSRNTLVNFRSLAAMSAIGRASLFFGDKDGSDQEHALHIGGLDNLMIHPVARGSHNVMMDLLERGELLKVLGDAC